MVAGIGSTGGRRPVISGRYIGFGGGRRIDLISRRGLIGTGTAALISSSARAQQISLPWNYNPLAYPADRASGIDLAHPAFGVLVPQAKLIGIASGANFINLQTGAFGTQSGTITAKINGNIGPTTVFGATASDFISMTTTAVLVTPTAKTYGVIFISTGSGAFQFIFSDTNSSSTDAIAISSGNTLEFFGFGGATGQIDSGMTVTANIPYFAALSINSGATNFILCNLLNGKTTTATAGGGALQQADTSAFEIGNVTAAHVFTGGIAAVAYFWTFLSLAQLRVWAADPWALWYPRQFDVDSELVGVAAATSVFKPAFLKYRGHK